MAKKAEEWVGKVMWMSRMKGQVEVDRGRMVRELIGRQSMERAAEVWRSLGRDVCRKPEERRKDKGDVW